MKGTMLDQFAVGDLVSFTTKMKPDRVGRIGKLHKSCQFGVAEIYPLDGTRKISRRLQNIRKTSL